MNYVGTDLKFRITSQLDELVLGRDDFTITVRDRLGHVRQVVKKSECFTDSEQQWYFTLENTQVGLYFAWFSATVGDNDYSELDRTLTDVQLIAEVTAERGCDCCDEEDHSQHIVAYEQVWTANMDDGTYLVGSDGALILTADGSRIKFDEQNMKKVQLDTLTASEFKELIEGRSDDGVVNTVPEVMDVGNDVEDFTEATEEQTREIVTNNS